MQQRPVTEHPATATQLPARNLAILEDEMTELAAHINAATCRLLALICEFDEHHGWSGAGFKSCAHWLNWKCGITLGAAHAVFRRQSTAHWTAATAAAASPAAPRGITSTHNGSRHILWLWRYI